MPSTYFLILIFTLCMVLEVHSYINPLEYSAASPLIARDRAAFLPNSEAVLEKRDYCGGMYCTCPNECIDENTCTTNVALLPCGGGDGGGGKSCEAGKQACPDGTGCCGVDEICDDTNNTCLGCDAGSTLCGDHCCGAGSICLDVGCQGDKTESDSSTLSSTSNTAKSTASNTAKSTTSNTTKSTASNTTPASVVSTGTKVADAPLSSTSGSSGKSTSTPNGAAITLKDSIGKCLALLMVGWTIIWL